MEPRIRINLLARRFIFLAHENAQVTDHFDWLLHHKLSLVVRRTRGFAWYRARRVGPLRFVWN
jgi:hypothetical protein